MKKIKYIMLGTFGGLALGLLCSKSLMKLEYASENSNAMKNKFHSSALDDLITKLEDVDIQKLSKTIRSKVKQKINELNDLLV